LFTQPHSSYNKSLKITRSDSILIAALCAGVFSVIFSNLLGSEIAKQNSNIWFVVTPFLFAILSFNLIRKRSLTRMEKSLLSFIVIFAVFRAAAEDIWIYNESVLKINPFPSIADFFWLAGDMFLFAFLLIYLKPIKNQISKKIKISAFLMSMLFLVPTVAGTFWTNGDANTFDLFVALAYPLIDALVLYPAIIGMTIIYGNRSNRFLSYLLFAILAITTADSLYVFLFNSYENGNPIDIGWIVGYTMLVFATLYYKPISRDKLQTHQDSKDGRKLQGLPSASIVNFIIPFAVIAIDLIASLVMVIFYLRNSTVNQEELMYLYGFFMIMGALSAFIFIYNRNLRQIMKNRVSGIELEKTSLEQMVEDEKLARLSAVGSLSARLAHDLRNPLSVIKTGMQIMKMKNLNMEDEEKERLAKMDRAVIRMSRQIESVLDYVTPRPLRFTPNKSLYDILKSTIDSLIVPQNVSIELPKNDICISCDPTKLEVLFANLITNSIEAMEYGGEIKFLIKDQGEMVSIVIEDSGSGIPEKVLQKIFDPLFTTKQTGTGLGLVSCKSIIEKHNGTIEAESELGKGSSFIVTLPKVPKYE
jgi:signal transduction histidine kinase